MPCPLREYTTTALARSNRFRVSWRNAVLGLSPKGTNMPLYSKREVLRQGPAPMTAPRYP